MKLSKALTSIILESNNKTGMAGGYLFKKVAATPKEQTLFKCRLINHRYLMYKRNVNAKGRAGLKSTA